MGSASAVACFAVSGSGGSWAFGVFLEHFGNYEATYGTLAGAIIFLLWLWMSNLALLVGALLFVCGFAAVQLLRKALQFQGVDPADKSIEFPIICGVILGGSALVLVFGPRSTVVAAPRNSTFAQAPPRLGGGTALTGNCDGIVSRASTRHEGIASGIRLFVALTTPPIDCEP